MNGSPEDFKRQGLLSVPEIDVVPEVTPVPLSALSPIDDETSTRESWYYTGTSYQSCSATAVVYSCHQNHWSLEEQTWPSRSHVLLFMQHTFLSSRTSFLQNSNGSPAPWLPRSHKKAAVWQSKCWMMWLLSWLTQYMRHCLNGKIVTLAQDGWSNIHNDPVLATCVTTDSGTYFLDAYWFYAQNCW